MRHLFFAFLFLLSSKVWSNCELMNWRFHTEAVYKTTDNRPLKVVQAQMRDGGILFIDDLTDYFKSNAFLENKNSSFGSLNKMSLERATMTSHKSTRGQLTFLKLKDELAWLPAEPLALINSKERTITTTGEKYFPEAKEENISSEAIPAKLIASLNSILKKKSLKIVDEVSDYSNGKFVKAIAQKIGEKSWKLVQVQVKFDLKKPLKIPNPYNVDIKGMTAWIAFLTLDDSSYWYIGNSSGNPCGDTLTYEARNVSKDGVVEVGGKLTANYGYRFAGKNDELVYSFGDPDVIYYLVFNELMLVVVNEIYR